MTFTLELNHINPTRDLFFDKDLLYKTEGATIEQANEFKTVLEFLSQYHIRPIIEKHRLKRSWKDGDGWSIRQVTRRQLPTGEYQLITRVPGFVSVAAAVEFFKDLVADGTEFRRLKREWHQANGILNETNVLDQAGNIVEVVHACQAHKCIRFGSCPSVGSGCATVPEHTHDGIYPIYHLAEG